MSEWSDEGGREGGRGGGKGGGGVLEPTNKLCT